MMGYRILSFQTCDWLTMMMLGGETPSSDADYILTSPLQSTTTMSFVCLRLAAGIAPRLRLFPSSNGIQSPFIAYRLLSTTSRRLQAEPVNVKHHFTPDRLDPPESKSPSGTAMLSAPDEGKYVDPYKGGPSAIDKAVHLFFLTEILRGAK